MKRLAFLALLLAAAPLFAQQAKPPELQFHSVPDFLKLPDGVYFGECVGVALDSKGNIYVANRGKHPLMEFHPDGTFMRYIGEGLDIHEAAHSVILDPQDNIWFIDAATNIIVRMDQQTRLQMVLGKKPEAWTWETHVVEHGAAGPSNFYQPTGLAVARRIQVFDAEGNFLKVWNNVGAPWAMCITPSPNQIIWSADGVSGRFYKLDLNGNVLGAFGKQGKLPGTFGWVHGVTCPNENTVLAAEELNYRVQKLVVESAR